MVSMKDLLRGYGPTVLIGVGMTLLARLVLPAVSGVLRPLVKGAVKGGLTLVDSVSEFAAEANEQVSDLIAEAKAEHYSKTG